MFSDYSLPSPSVKTQIMGGKVCLRCKIKPLLGLVSKLLKTNLITSSDLSSQWFEFSLKVKVIRSTPGCLLKSFLLYIYSADIYRWTELRIDIWFGIWFKNLLYHPNFEVIKKHIIGAILCKKKPRKDNVHCKMMNDYFFSTGRPSLILHKLSTL